MPVIQMEFNENKTINAVLYIVMKLKRSDFHKIFKILYFSDREHLREYGRTITGDRYIAMSDGPVPSNLYDIFKSVRGDGYFKDNGKFGVYFSVIGNDLIKAHKEPDLKKLAKTDIQHIDNSLELYGNLSWDEIREKSHDYAWRSTIINRQIKFEDILWEAGGDDEFVEYVQEQNLLINLCKQC
jgi:uncharacterized phage-associated protein